MNLELQCSRSLDGCGPVTPRLIARWIQAYSASLDCGAEIKIAVPTGEPDSGDAVMVGRIQDQGEGAEGDGRHAVILELWLQLPDLVEPGQSGWKIAQTKVNVIESHRAFGCFIRVNRRKFSTDNSPALQRWETRMKDD